MTTMTAEISKEFDQMAAQFGLNAESLKYMATKTASMMTKDGVTAQDMQGSPVELCEAYLMAALREERKLTERAIMHPKQFAGIMYDILKQN